MKKSEKFIGIYAVTYLLFEIQCWPGTTFFRSTLFLFAAAFYVAKLVAEPFKQNSKTLRFVTYSTMFTFLSLQLYTLFKLMFWLSWQLIEVIALALLSVLLVINIFKKNIQSASFTVIKSNPVLTVISLTGIGMMIIPYSEVLKYTELNYKTRMGRVNDNVEMCRSYRRYHWALREEGKFEKVREIEEVYYLNCTESGSTQGK